MIYIILKGGIVTNKYETYKTLDSYGIDFVGKINVSYFSGTDKDDVEVITSTEEIHSIKIKCQENRKYVFTITDESKKEYTFEYYYDDASKSIVLNMKND